MNAKEFRRWIEDNVDDDATIECVVAHQYGHDSTMREATFDKDIAKDGNYAPREDGKHYEWFTVGCLG